MRSAWLLTSLIAATTATAAPKPIVSAHGITEYRLDNGLRVLLFPDDSRPNVTVNMTYFVGSRHEGYGETGMAHLLEHMLFRATRRYPNMDKLYEQRGGYSNGSTAWDRTNYFVSLPSKGDNLTFALDVAFDQMNGALLRAEDLAKEFSVVRNEFEIGENSPDNVLAERILSTAYLWHNYGKSPIGSRADIERVTVDRLRPFYEKYYRPDNAMLIVAGKFDPKEALRLAVRQAAKIKRPKAPLPKTYTVEPVQDGERFVSLERVGDVAVLGVAFHAVAGTDPRAPAAIVLADVLGQKPWGRLYKNLVETNLATEVSAMTLALEEPGVVMAMIKLRRDQSLDKARAALTATLDQLKTKPITEEEVARSRARWEKSVDLQLANPELIGIFLSDFASLGDWRMLFVLRDRIRHVTAADVQSFAEDFTKASNRTLGLFRPTTTPDRAPMATAPDVQSALKEWRPEGETVAGQAFDISLPNIEKHTVRASLAGGMQVALLPKKARGGLVSGEIELHFGSEETLRGRIPAALLVGPMLLRGTKRLSYQQIRDRLDQLKAEVQFSGDVPDGEAPPLPGRSDTLVIQFQTKRENLAALIDLLSEILQQPSFPVTEWEPLRRGLLSHFEEASHEPMRIAMIELMRRVNPVPATSIHYRPALTEQVEWLKKVDLEMVKQVYETSFGASGMHVGIVGDLDAAAVKAQLEEKFGGWRAKQPWVRVPYALYPSKADSALVRTPDKQTAMIAVGLAFPMNDEDPDVPALDLATHALGRGFNSRLIGRMRTKEGISYSTFANLQSQAIDPVTVFLAAAMAANPSARRGASILREEITRWAQHGLTKVELDEFKRNYQEAFRKDLGDDEYLASLLDSTLVEKKTLAYYEDLQKKVQALTLDKVNETLRRRIDPKQLVEVIAGDVQ